MFEAIFYTSESGQSPIDKFLDGLEVKPRAKIEAIIHYLEQKGSKLKRPFAAHVRGKIWELRTVFASNQYRVLYFSWIDDRFVLLHGFSKKSRRLRERDISLAESRMENWLKRYGKGK